MFCLLLNALSVSGYAFLNLSILSHNILDFSDGGESEQVFRFSFSEPVATKSEMNGYDTIVLDDLACMGGPGEPVIPFKTVRILLPADKIIDDVEVSPGEKLVLEQSLMIEPGQEPVPLSLLDEENLRNIAGYVLDEQINVFTEPDPVIYNSDDAFPGVIYKEGSIQNCCGYSILILNLFPVQYIPKQGKVFYYKDMTVNVLSLIHI